MEPWIAALAPYLCLALALALASLGHYWFWVRRFTVPVDYDEHHRLPTSDGSHFELRRLVSPQDTVPVLLVHGLAANHRNMDPEPHLSLARHLRDAGRDVWLLTLRSGRPAAWGEPVHFAAMVEHDVPRAIDEVLERTAATELDYVGFSMGGILLYGALGRTVPEAHIRRVVTIGSPGRVGVPFRFLRFLPVPPRWLVPSLGLRWAARMVSPLADFGPTPLHRAVYQRANTDRGRAPRALVNMVESIPGRLQADFAVWAMSDGLVRVGADVAVDGLAKVDIPALFFAGAGDRMAPVFAVRAAYEAWGRDSGADKELRVLARAEGAAADYGHGDMAIGRHVARDVFEPTIRFLAQR